jgi:succinate dehydrogenase / fumarate reductase flavoprotein subunit
MQGLADGYFVLPYTIQNCLADQIRVPNFSTDTPEWEEAENQVKSRVEKLLSINGKQSVDSLHKKLGKIMWEYVGMARTKEGTAKAVELIKELKEEFWRDVRVVGTADEMNNELEKALRLADYIELGELMARDAHDRDESCGGHFRVEYQTDSEAERNDKDFMHVAAWEFTGENADPKRNVEDLNYETVKVAQRNYK